MSISHALKPYAHPMKKRVLNKLCSRYAYFLPYPYTKHFFDKHDTALKASKVIPDDVFTELYKFAFVRNPWDWLLSLYKYIHQNKAHHRNKKVSHLADFEAYIRYEIARGKENQSKFLFGKNGQCLVDFIGRYESLEVDFAKITEAIGVAETLPHINASKHKSYHDYYNAKTRNLVAQHWARDIEVFKYCFE